MAKPPSPLRTRPLTQFQGIIIAVFTFLTLLALSIPISIGQYRLDEANERLQAADVRVCDSRKEVVALHNKLATTMAALEREDATHNVNLREAIAQAWEDSVLPNPDC